MRTHSNRENRYEFDIKPPWGRNIAKALAQAGIAKVQANVAAGKSEVEIRTQSAGVQDARVIAEWD